MRVLWLLLLAAGLAAQTPIPGPGSGEGGGGSSISGLTPTAIVTAASATTVQTPSATATMDASGNISTRGSISSGVGSGLAGADDLQAGTAHTAIGVGFQAPTAITTPFMMTLPALPATGFLFNTGTADPGVLSFVAGTGSGSVVRATSPTLVAPALGTPVSGIGTNITAIPNANVLGTPVPTPGTSITLTAPRGYAICTGTCTVTVPVPAAGNEFCIMNDDNVATAITLAALGSSAMYENQARTAYGTAGTGTLVVAAAAANKVCIVGRDTTHYLTVSNTGGAITVN